MALFPESRVLADEIERILFSISANFDRALRFRYVAADQVIAEEAKEIVVLNDREAFQGLVLTWERLCRDLGSGASNMLELSFALSIVAKGGEALEKAARDLDMPEMERRIRKRMELRTEASKVWRGKADPRPMNFLGRVMGLSLSVPDQPIDPSLFEPGRRVEYALADRAMAIVAAVLLLLMVLGAGIESVRRGKRVNGLAEGLQPFFQAFDRAWIFVLGVVLPVGFYLIITRLTPLGCRDIGLVHYSIPPALIQAAAALLLSLTLLLEAIRWRIGRRAGFLGLKSRWQWTGRGIAAITACLIPLSGAVRWTTGNGDDFLRPVAAACGIPLLWLCWQAGAVLFSPKDHALAGTLLVRRLIAPLLVLTSLLLACGPVLERTERAWLSRDTITRSDPTHGGLLKWEAMTVDWTAGRFKAAFEDVK